ncbi:hypothetical protein MsAg5_17460 [Methanosarcinaceae archaeon Ag5]|uniref:PIN domain-containing protein n=1 Tax=Methanolapillus africanus TaxID=3028297 RepID=A0AAE4MKY3_9EURY|nr:hypothetical protein [Methanosarcinaceae archaeon Ag5]
MSKIVLDANIPISFIHERVDLWNLFCDIVKTDGHTVIMPAEVYDEVSDWKTKRIFQNEDFIQKVDVDVDLFRQIKNECDNRLGRNMIQDNDFRVLTAAVENNADILVSNDYELINVFGAYKTISSRKIKCRQMTTPVFLAFLYDAYPLKFDLNSYIAANLKYYNHIEIPNAVGGIKIRNWDEKMVKSRFLSFQNNIINSLKKGVRNES